MLSSYNDVRTGTAMGLAANPPSLPLPVLARSLSSAFGRQPPSPTPAGRGESGCLARFVLPNAAVVVGRPRSRFLFRGAGGGHVIMAAFRTADGGNVATAICRAAGGGDHTHGIWGTGWRRPGHRPAALLFTVRQVMGKLPRATRAVSGFVHRPRCHRRQLSDLLAFVRKVFDVGWLPGCSAGGTVSAASTALDARALGLWFSVSKVGSDGPR